MTIVLILIFRSDLWVIQHFCG